MIVRERDLRGMCEENNECGCNSNASCSGRSSPVTRAAGLRQSLIEQFQERVTGDRAAIWKGFSFELDVYPISLPKEDPC